MRARDASRRDISAQRENRVAAGGGGDDPRRGEKFTSPGTRASDLAALVALSE